VLFENTTRWTKLGNSVISNKRQEFLVCVPLVPWKMSNFRARHKKVYKALPLACDSWCYFSFPKPKVRINYLWMYITPEQATLRKKKALYVKLDPSGMAILFRNVCWKYNLVILWRKMKALRDYLMIAQTQRHFRRIYTFLTVQSQRHLTNKGYCFKKCPYV
jgi:hypothetical protein